jgi:hypothetical protein
MTEGCSGSPECRRVNVGDWTLHAYPVANGWHVILEGPTFTSFTVNDEAAAYEACRALLNWPEAG